MTRIVWAPQAIEDAEAIRAYVASADRALAMLASRPLSVSVRRLCDSHAATEETTMMLVRLSGHSGAGKSRLLAALPRRQITCPRAVLYTSRLRRDEEAHGSDFYFLSRGAIAALPASDFYIGPVREMLQAVDLSQLEADLRSSSLVMVEIFADLWPGLIKRLEERLRCSIPNVSVFMTAVDPKAILAQPKSSQGKFIQDEVERILAWRAKDAADKITSRAKSAVSEVLTAIGPDGSRLYTRIFHSSPEGPTGQDEWTQTSEPTGDANRMLDEFVSFYHSIAT